MANFVLLRSGKTLMGLGFPAIEGGEAEQAASSFENRHSQFLMIYF